MFKITLTQAQVDAVADFYRKGYEDVILGLEKDHMKQLEKVQASYASLQRRTNARVDRANARTADWRSKYNDMRKQLIEARTELFEMRKRRQP